MGHCSSQIRYELSEKLQHSFYFSALALLSQALKSLNTKITALNSGRKQETDLDSAAPHLGSQGEV